TNSGAAAKGKISILWQSFGKFSGPALRFEIFRFVKVSRIPVHDPLRHQDLCSGRHMIAANLAIIQSLTAHAPVWRIKSHGFFYDRASVTQPRKISPAGTRHAL